MKITTKFDIEEKVAIIELEVKGRVKSIWITNRGIKYEVRYFDKAKEQEVYFYEDELEKNEKH